MQSKQTVEEFYAATNSASAASTASQVHESVADSSGTHNINNNINHLKLPPINLKKINGEYKNWL